VSVSQTLTRENIEGPLEEEKKTAAAASATKYSTSSNLRFLFRVAFFVFNNIAIIFVTARGGTTTKSSTCF
jgi:hypothetical protein